MLECPRIDAQTWNHFVRQRHTVHFPFRRLVLTFFGFTSFFVAPVLLSAWLTHAAGGGHDGTCINRGMINAVVEAAL